MLDQDIVNLAKAIRQVESGNRAVTPAEGSQLGGKSRYQYTRDTWKSVAGKYLGNPNAEMTLENENKATYSRLLDWKKQGYDPGQIASMWNAGEGRPNAHKENFRGTNKYGVRYDVPAYVNKVYNEYKSVKKTRSTPEVKTIDNPALGLRAQFLTRPDGRLATETRGTGSFETQKGKEIDHEIPVSLGGTSQDPNLSFKSDASFWDKLTQKDPFKRLSRQDGKMAVELKVIQDYKDGKIELPEARQRVLNWDKQPEPFYKTLGKELLSTTKDALTLPFRTVKNSLTREGGLIDNVQESVKTPFRALETGVRGIRASSQGIATIPAAAGAFADPEVTPKQAATESLKMAKDVFTREVDIDAGVEQAAQMYLKKRGVGKYGDNEANISDIAALTALGFVNFLGDPVFAVGGALKGIKALKNFAKFKKVGTIKKPLAEGAKFVGKGKQLELPITPDLKMTITPSNKQITFKGYKRRFPTQKELPGGNFTDETTDLLRTVQEEAGTKIRAKFVGDDLIIAPREAAPVQAPVKAVKVETTPVPKEEEVLVTEAKKYKSAEEFVKAKEKDVVYHGSHEPLDSFDESGAFFTDDFNNADGYAGGENVYEGYLDLRKPLIIDAKGRHYADLKTKYGQSTEEVVSNVEKLGEYDGVIFKNVNDSFADDVDLIGEDTIMYPFNAQKQFLNESQLEDIWKKATTPTKPPVAKKQPPKPVTPKKPVKVAPKPELPVKEVKVPRKQIPVGEGKLKASKLEERVNKFLGDVKEGDADIGAATFKEMSKAENIKKASEFVTKNPEDALKVLSGDMQAPEGVLNNSIFIAMSNLAKGDVALGRRLASLQATRFGQELSVLTELDPNSPVKKLEEIVRVREEAFKKALKGSPKKKLTAEQKKIQREIKAVKKSEKDLNDFIDSIIC